MLPLLTLSTTARTETAPWCMAGRATFPALPALNDFAEHWLPDAELSERGSWIFARSEQWLMAFIERPLVNAEADSYELYRELLTAPELQGLSIARLWNFVPEINQGNGDDEVYRQFCLGRFRAFQTSGVQQYPAATAVGATGDKLQVYVLCTPQKVLLGENPLQTPAWQYPRQYGPASPSFARVSHVLASDNAPPLWFVSGTAAVIGHESQHALDVRAQTTLSLENIAQLVPNSAKPLYLKVYIRNTTDTAGIEAEVQRLHPNVPLCLLQADICRRDLLVEIEAVFVG